MKIEIGESLCYSFLRHIKQCWLVQANWKASENWPKRNDIEMECIFTHMKERFDPDGSVFKGTRSCSQFLKQGEIDVVGVELDGSVHAVEVAYHEAGLNYTGGVANRVLKKLLRTVLILDAYHPDDTKRHIYFVSPKVHRGAQEPLEDTFNQLGISYPNINWHLITNDEFGSQILSPTLEKAAAVADTSELFVRSAKLLELTGTLEREQEPVLPQITADRTISTRREKVRGVPSVGQSRQIQPLVRSLMTTLLEDFPDILSQAKLRKLTDVDYCRHELDLKLGGFALLRRRESGQWTERYWAKLYGRRYYITNNWWPNNHCHNARSLIRFVGGLIDSRPEHTGVSELRKHRMALRDYIRKFC